MHVDGRTFVNVVRRGIGDLDHPQGLLGRDAEATPTRVAEALARGFEVRLPGLAVAHFGRPLVRTLIQRPRIELRVVRHAIGIEVMALLLLFGLEPDAVPTVLRMPCGRLLTNVPDA